MQIVVIQDTHIKEFNYFDVRASLRAYVLRNFARCVTVRPASLNQMDQIAAL